MGVSMSIVIGGNHANPREAFVGGLTGGALYMYMVLMTMAAVARFVGFDTLMTSVYPVIGYIGMAMIVVLVFWWFTHRDRIDEETRVRYRLTALLGMKQSERHDFTDRNEEQVEEAAGQSVVDAEEVTDAVDAEAGDHVSSGSASTRS